MLLVSRMLLRLRSRRAKALVSLALVLVIAWIGWHAYRLQVGAPSGTLDASWTEGTRVLARDGRLLGERPSAEGLRGRTTKLDDVSPRLVDATLASEDRSFFSHDGVDRFALVRATLSLLTRGRVISGGSTITMQLVKRVDHHGRPRPRTIGAKLSEMARAQNLEARTDKRTILEAYLNKLDYGRGLAGPEAAALGYFGVHAKDVSLAQAALLAVLPRAPSALDPYRHRDRAVLRQRALLQRMHADGKISAEDLDRALSEPLVFRDKNAPRPFLAPHVVVSARGAKEVHTTLDFDLQHDVEALVKSHIPRLEERGASTAAVVVVDPKTGEVLAEVSGPDWNDTTNAGRVDLVRARRQAGSTLKPFVYARAFERGTSPMEMLADVPTDFGANGSSYAPENFDGTFVGPISAREALAGSLNVPAVKLAAGLGAADVVSTLRQAGVPASGGAERYGLSIALGSAEVTPLELAESYTSLARGGEHVPLHDRVQKDDAAVRVLDAAAVALVTEALADPVARIRGLRTRGPFELPFPVAVKTGTSTAYRDAWTAGYTHERVVVVWVGNADGSATTKLTGAVGAGPLFTDVMKRAMRDVKDRGPLFDRELLEEAEVCPLSGHRPGAACNTHVKRLFARGHAPRHACPIHKHVETSPLRCKPDGVQRIVVLPDVYGRWLDAHAPGAPGIDPYGTPFHLATRIPDCGSGIAEEPRIVLVAPRDGSVVVGGNAAIDTVEVNVETHGLPAHEPLEVVLDGRVALRLAGARRGHVGIGRGDHQLEVRPADPSRGAMLGRAAFSVR